MSNGLTIAFLVIISPFALLVWIIGLVLMCDMLSTNFSISAWLTTPAYIIATAGMIMLVNWLVGNKR